jgi:HPt (histidine-containing phosphotransfer) domain-containing protein
MALTANALTGNDEMFAQHGFDGFIPKPIDIKALDTALNRFIHDRRKDIVPIKNIDAKLAQVFRRDADKAVEELQRAAENHDAKRFASTAHAMKSALLNIGEKDLSALAAQLERAGQSGDMDAIIPLADSLCHQLNTLRLRQTPEDAAAENECIIEDTAHLAGKLREIISACADYDDTKAYAALDELAGKNWRPKTAAELEEIRNILFLHSDFEEAAEKASDILGAIDKTVINAE